MTSLRRSANQSTREGTSGRRHALAGISSKSMRSVLHTPTAPGSPLRHRSKYELRSISLEGSKVLPWTARLGRDGRVEVLASDRGRRKHPRDSVSGKMLCLDMKLVSRLRGVSLTSGSSTSVSPVPSSATSTSSTSASLEKRKRSKGRRESGSVTESDSEEEAAPPPHEMIRRNRSRSVCVSALPSTQLRYLHRRASHHVSTTDAIARRGVLSRRYYGSVEMLPQIEQDGSDNGRRFRVENGDSPGEKEEMFGSPSTPILENPEYQTRWYFKYFLGKLHQNYVAADQERNPLFLSVVTSEVSDQSVPHYRVILWRKTGAQKISLPYSANKTITIRQILSNFFGLEKLDKVPREVFSPEIQKDLLLLEEQEGSVNFKFGVIYAKKGQTTDDEMLSNEQSSPEFENFLEIMGERIWLKNWDKYRGGLDVKGDMTGKESYYTVYAGHEVMYHVSTMLPYSKDNPQQLERKRHIGNDIVNIIYTDDPDVIDTFNPNCIRSQFTHVFAVVSTEENNKGWRVAIYCDESVPLFGPSLPCPPVFEDPFTLREFLLVKLINGEKATFNTPTFSRKRERTLDALLRDMYQEHTQEGKSNSMLNRRALSDVVEAPGRRREETRAVEVVRVGQALKLEAIVRGLAPTSLATAGPLKPRPWEPRCIYPDFPHEVVCGDVWLDSKVILATESGTFLIEDCLSHRMIFDESVQIKQLDVVEQHGILLFRTGDKGKESNVYVFRLREFENGTTANRSGEVLNEREDDQDCEDNGDGDDVDDDADESEDNDWDNFSRATAKFKPSVRPRGRIRVRPLAVRGRSHIKDRRLQRSRGCHLYTTTMPGGSHLRMCVAVGRRLTVLQWKHSAAWTAWCSTADTDTVDGFTVLKEFNASETPSLVTMIESTDSANEWTLCCGVRHHFELISATGSTRVLHIDGTSKPHLVAALDLCEDEEPELILCYNNTCHFQKLVEENTAPSEFDFNWNSVPAAIACAFPYVIAFTKDTMEIRLIINGNLVHTMAMPNLNLITSKQDIFFATTAPEFLPRKCERIRLDAKPSDKEEPVSSPPPFAQSSSSRSNSQNSQNDWKPIRIYQIPLQTLSRSNLSICAQRRCPSPIEPEITSAPPTSDRTFLTVEPHRALSRSCSSSPTPTPTNLMPPHSPLRK